MEYKFNKDDKEVCINIENFNCYLCGEDKQKKFVPFVTSEEKSFIICNKCLRKHIRENTITRPDKKKGPIKQNIKCKHKSNCNNLAVSKGYCKKHYASMFRKKQNW